jgi:hypothetical protein
MTRWRPGDEEPDAAVPAFRSPDPTHRSRQSTRYGRSRSAKLLFAAAISPAGRHRLGGQVAAECEMREVDLDLPAIRRHALSPTAIDARATEAGMAGQQADRELRQLMGATIEHGTRTAGDYAEGRAMASTEAATGAGKGRGWHPGAVSAGLATLVSIVALLFSGYSFYETVLKQAELRFYQPPMIYMFRQDFRDVLAIPVTISNDGAKRGTILDLDLEVVHRKTGRRQKFQALHYGSSPRADVRLFSPITVNGGSSFTDVVLFYALETGSFVDTTGGVELPLQMILQLEQDTSGAWYAPSRLQPVTFDMTARWIAGLRDMEAGRPTRLHDARWMGRQPVKE